LKPSASVCTYCNSLQTTSDIELLQLAKVALGGEGAAETLDRIQTLRETILAGRLAVISGPLCDAVFMLSHRDLTGAEIAHLLSQLTGTAATALPPLSSEAATRAAACYRSKYDSEVRVPVFDFETLCKY